MVSARALQQPAADVVEGTVGERAIRQDDGNTAAGLGEFEEQLHEQDFETLGFASHAKFEPAQYGQAAFGESPAR